MGRVTIGDVVVPWVVLDDAGLPVEPIGIFLRDFVARGNRPASVRSYAYALLRWWRWLRVVEVSWDRAGSAEVRDLVLWLQCTSKPRRSARTASALTVGTVNPVTGKQYLNDGYASRTVRHSNAVVASFYEFWMESGSAPLLNPVVRERVRGRRANAHHNPLLPYRPEGKLRYNPKVARRRPRAMKDEQWLALFKAARSNRDRSLLAIAVSSGARATELLGIRFCDVNWGEQLVRLHRKGTGAEQWVPASPESFVWLRLYLSECEPGTPDALVFTTLRRRDRGAGLGRQPLSYDALRAMLRRVNAVLGANWTMHDLRHTCALRMAHDENLSLRDVQTILGHAHLATTADVYLVEDEQDVLARVAAHLTERRDRGSRPAVPPAPAVGYDAGDLDVLLGAGSR